MDYHKFFTDIMIKKEAGKKPKPKKETLNKRYSECEQCHKPTTTNTQERFAVCFKCNKKNKELLNNRF